MIKKYRFLLISSLALGLALTAFVFTVKADIENIFIDPALNISRFTPYKIKAEISNNPVSASVEVLGINGNSTSTPCWNYYRDGTCGSQSPITKNMIFNSVSVLWESTNIYPDDIYPEIFFTDSDISWYNAPSEDRIWRRNYHILQFDNHFDMVADMSFFIEFNAVPNNTSNSNDLFVYLLAKEAYSDPNYFTSDWRSKDYTELVGTVSRNDAFHHVHTDNSAHHLVALSTNSDGTIGFKSLDVSGEFMVILYQDSNNTNRGWNLRYHDSSVCVDRGGWLIADRSGGGTWNTPALQAGCPDAHVHIARGTDGVEATVTAVYGDSSTSSDVFTTYFTPLPNLPPNSTSFISPVVSGVYDGSNITVSWNPATDPNNDPLVYSIYLLDSEGVVTSTLVTATTTTSFSWDITGLPNGEYSLKGVITEVETDDLFNTDFFLGGNFNINKAVPVYSLSSINIISNNTNDTSLAKAGDQITLTFTASGEISPQVNIQSGGNEVQGPINIASSTNVFTVTYVVDSVDTDGAVSFTINADNLDQTYEETSDDSVVLVDTTAPAIVVASPGTGTYSAPQNVILSSVGADSIRYTIDGSEPSCSVGTTYSSAITVSSPTTIKAIACDYAGNYSEASFEYNFQYTLTYTAGAGGTITGTSTQIINHGSDGAAVTAVPDTGYSFVEWSDDSTANSRTDINVTSNISFTAEFAINQYTLTFDSDGGSTVSPIIQDYATAITPPADPTKTGYTFAGWSPTIPATMSAGDQTHIAQWTTNQYTLTYTAGAGGTITGTSTQLVNHGLDGSEVIVVPDTGYHFVSWSDGVLTASRTDINVTANITSTANFAINDSVTLNYTAGTGGTIIGSSTQVFAAGLDGTAVTASSSPGYTFLKWSDDSTDNPRTDLSVIRDIFNTAIFTPYDYTLTFEAQGGLVSPATTTVTFASAVGTLPTPTRTGYTFTGWNSVSDGMGTSYTSSTIYEISNDSTIFAQWTINQYTLTFNSASGSAVSPITQDYATAITPPAHPTKTGYAFTAWDPVIPDTMPASNQAHTAQWTANQYILTFNAQEGTVSPATTTVTFDSAVGALPIPTRTGYTFTGWYTESSGGTQYTSTTTYQIDSDLTLHAQWTASNYIIAFNSQGGSSSSSQSVTYNLTVGSLPSPTKTGYTFAGWYTEANGLGVNYTSPTVYLLTENVVLIANWTPNVYTLTFDSDGGSTVDSIIQDYNTDITPPIDPSKTGYTFASWNPELPTTIPAGNRTYIAQWTINQYTLTYSAGANGSLTGDTSQTVNYNSNSTTVTAVADDGYQFHRWSDNSTANPRTDNNVAGNISVTAEFLLVSRGGSTFTPPPAIGDGLVDITIPMNSVGGIGQIDSSGVNYLSYIGSQANFSTPISTTNNLSSHWLVINNLDLSNQIVSFTIKSEPQTFQLSLGDYVLVDLDSDGIKDIEVRFTDLLVNRSELTIKSILGDQIISPSSKELPALDRQTIIQEARNTFINKNLVLSKRLAGKILLQVEKNGQAWYLDPVSQARYYLGRPADAFAIMRHFGLGVSETNFNKFSRLGTPSHLAGRIILRVEANGEAYYINPVNLHLHYLGRPVDAFAIMQELSLGISNANLDQLVVGEINY